MPSVKRYYTVTVEHLPLDGQARSTHIWCKVKDVPAFDSEEACQKAIRFLLIQGKRNVRVKSVEEQKERNNGKPHSVQPRH